MERDQGSVNRSQAGDFARKALEAALAAGDTRAAATASGILAKLEIAAGRDLEHLERIALDAAKVLANDRERLEIERQRASGEAGGERPSEIHFHVHPPEGEPEGE